MKQTLYLLLILFISAVFLNAQDEELIRPYVWNDDPTVISYEKQIVS